MEINHAFQKNVLVFRIIGDFDWSNVTRAGKYIMPFLDELDTVQALAFNLAEVQIIDSSGIGLLLEVAKTMQKSQIPVCIWGLNAKKQEQFQMMHMDRVFRIYANADEGLSLLQNTSSLIN